MKAFIKRLVRRLARWPGVGAAVRSAVAVARAPYWRADELAFRQTLLARFDAAGAHVDGQRTEAAGLGARLDALGARLDTQLAALGNRLDTQRDALGNRLDTRLDALDARLDDDQAGATLDALAGTVAELDRRLAALTTEHDAFVSRQLPALLESLSEINHRVVQRSKEQDNLIRSVPVALRALTREQHALRERAEATAAQIDEAGAVPGVVDALRSRLEAFEQRTADRPAEVAGLVDSVSYLLGRVEFVRRELMFELRYGAKSPAGGDALEATTEILSPDKLEAAKAHAVRLNLGCGHVPLDGYLNVDRRGLPGVDIVAEVDRLPFEADEVDEIFSAHLIEHFPQEELRRALLPYWHRLLKPGGTFGAVAPDADGLMQAYATKEYPFDQVRTVTFGGQDYDGDFHFNMLTPASLTALLVEAGFGDVRVIAANRENGGCKEFEVRATRL